MKLMFVLPSRGGGGGAHSVVQEALGLQRLGAEVAIATTTRFLHDFHANYPELERSRVAVQGFAEPGELARLADGQAIACATTFESVHTLAAALAGLKKRPRTAYYVQDYEPLFCLPGSDEWHRARRSYAELPDATLFAKTRFLCDIVALNHGRQVERVKPSIDHGVFHPGHRPATGQIVVSAMIRPKTPRRAPRRTARILERIVARHGDAVRVVTFGASAEELARVGIRLSPGIDVRGALSRHEVAGVLRASSLFLDLSDYQAFGRTGLEGMACGCVPVVPVFGGTDEYIRHWVNGFAVDIRSDDAIMAAVDGYLALPPTARDRLRLAAIETALDYSVEKAALSEFRMFQGMRA